ncbi:type I-C CRISPR-associated protein Cas8c/Csd1 [Uliginosibacterium paludis]|uniref:Type I-C CRISPR-associated protein Cas8c/Csd1 n=1 Tax=Uliginosibacterium paludis TaxID=1615952 RepID=A0ABV2CPU5_9RHOO
MILQALNDYYQRKQNDADSTKRLPAFGLEQKEIPFVLEITADGALVQLRDTREQVGNKKIGQSFRVPQGIKKTSGVAANLLWDSSEYVLGVEDPKKLEQSREKGKEADYRARLIEMHKAFVDRIALLPPPTLDDAGVQAVLQFLSNEPLAQAQAQANFSELAASSAVLSFRLHGDIDLVCQRPAVLAAAINTPDEDDTPQTMCLVTGEVAPIERLHTAIKGVWGAQTSGANIVSFNARAFESYGKTERQGENAPVSKAAAFAYTTALNHLLGKESSQRIQVGDASTVFWAEREDDELESALANIFGEPPKDDPDRNTRAVHAMYSAVNAGKLAVQKDENRFHVLGLAPNAARISVRFYHCLPLSDLASRIVAWFDDLKMARGPNDPEFPSLFRLLTAVSVQGKADNIPPNLGGAVIDAVLAGPDVPFPRLWLNAAINRCRAEQSINYLRAAVIKACLNRNIRRHSSTEKEFLPMLDPANDNAAYRLGRLFSVLERIQESASPNLNATIRDRYYGAASSTPVAVFTTLLRLKNAHLKKLPAGQVVWFEKLLADVLGPISDFPKHLPLQDQGRFALGYYHQRQAFFTKSDDKQTTTEESAA